MRGFLDTQSGMTFSGLEQLKTHVKKLDKAEIRTVTVAGKEAESFKAVWNTTKNKLETVTNKQNVINHEDIFKIFTDVIDSKEVKVEGVVKNLGGLVEVQAVFPDKRFDVIKGDNYDLGIRLKNNYSGRNPSILAEAFAYRIVCSNGMFLGDVIAKVRIPHSNKTTTDIEKKLADLLHRIIERGQTLKTLVNEARDEKLENKDAREIVLGETKRIKRAKKIVDYMLKESTNSKELTKYTVFNAITQYSTHDSQTTMESERLNKIAQRVLTTPVSELNRTVWREKKEKDKS